MTNQKPTLYDLLIVGAGFTGLTAALEAAENGLKVCILEADKEPGGLAGSFLVGDTRLEKFYHHWFTNDLHVMNLIKRLGLEENILLRPTRTGMYYANNFFKLSTPKDLLSFTPLSFVDRIRLGLLTLRARKVRDWRSLENQTAEEWLTSMGGQRVYKTIWEPLLRGKFGKFAPDISAVWFWSKLKLRGGSRDSTGKEVLAYYRGGFAALADELTQKIESLGGTILLDTRVANLIVENNRAIGASSLEQDFHAKTTLVTTSLPNFSDLVKSFVDQTYIDRIAGIKYIGNVCLVLQLSRSLSETYWLNVNDPTFPYVAVIEHTNFEPPETYAGRHIVYLSKYLPTDEDLFCMSDEEVLQFSIPHIQRMFPTFKKEWILDFSVWRAECSQPIVVKNYSQLIPEFTTPINELYLCTMAQVYPEDRGTSYAIRNGSEAGIKIVDKLRSGGDAQA